MATALENRRKECEQYLEKGLLDIEIAGMLGISQQLVSATLKNKPKVREWWDAARQRGSAKGSLTMMDHGQKDWKALAWMLERRYPDNFALRAAEEPMPIVGEPEERNPVIYEWLRAHEHEPIVFLQGTARSGKTYGVMQYLVDKWQSNRGGYSLVAGNTFPMLKNGACQYLTEIAAKRGLQTKRDGTRLENARNKIVCQSFDEPNKALSSSWQRVFVNEGNIMDERTIDNLRVRCKGQMIVDFNPSVSDWWGAALMTPENTLITKWQDNPFITHIQRKHIESIRERGEKAPVGSYAWWYYQVYYLGNFAAIGGGVFDQLVEISDADYDAIEGVEYFGLDFGDVSDPNALVGVKYDIEGMYVRSYISETGIGDTELANKINARMEHGGKLVFETATAGKTRYLNMRPTLNESIAPIPAYKPGVQQSVFNMSTQRIHCVTGEAFDQFSKYRIKDGQFVGEDHAIDAARYVDILYRLNRL